VNQLFFGVLHVWLTVLSLSISRYLWTLPMFHCNGWNFMYTLAAVGGTSICLRELTVCQHGLHQHCLWLLSEKKSVCFTISSFLAKLQAASIGGAIASNAVTHLCGAPIVVDRTIEYAAGQPYNPPIKMMVAAAPPTEATLTAAAAVGMELTHCYGLTETCVIPFAVHFNRLSYLFVRDA
jgi:fatty-acyl-CoA synthase